MEFRLLGPLEVREGGRTLPLGGPKQRALLAVLLLHANEVVSRDRLIDDLWGDRPPETAVASVQVYVSRLRKILSAGRLVTQAPGYVLRVDADQLDMHRFERLVGERRYDDALRLWRGPPLAEFADEPFARPEIARLEELRLAALEERIEADLERGRHTELVGELEQLIALHPLRERLRGQLMLALYRSGRQAEALEAYQAARRALVDELGIDPGAPLQRLEKAILIQDSKLDVLPPPGAAAPSTAFVGREAELAELVDGLESAIAGRGRLFLLGGEPGVGKSRLAEELSAHARARAVHVLLGRCWEAGGAPAYWPWVEALRGYVREADPTALRSQLGAGAADLAQVLPELRERFPDLPEPPPLDAETARFRLFDAASEFLRRAAGDRPIVLGLDDLHAADTPSLLLLQYVARQLGSTRVLVVGTYRDVDPIPGAPLTAMLAEVTREPVTRRLALRGLEESDVARYIDLTASEIASTELASTVYVETEGNPLFVGEIVRLLAVEGVSNPSSAGVALAIPRSVHDVIGRRLAHLSEACNRLLVLASVLGREFAVGALARLVDVEEDELVETLDEAIAARVIADVPATPSRMRFAHVLIRDVLYDNVTAARRVRLHRQVLAALETLYGSEPSPFLAELAHHAIAGTDFDKGYRYAQRAGDRALDLLAYEEAARLYETALEALELSGMPDDKFRCELLLSLGEAEGRAGNMPAAKKTFLEAAGSARRLGVSRELARAAAGYAGRIVWARAGDDERLVPLLEEGLAVLADEDVELRARLLARLSGALRDELSRDRRDRLSAEAVELARRTGDPSALAYALDGRSAAIQSPDTVAERLELATELLDVASRIGDRERMAHAHVWRFVAQVETSDLSGADLAAAIRIAEEMRQPAQLLMTTGAQSMIALGTGRLRSAEELIPKVLAVGERTQRDAATAIHRLQRYGLCELHGHLAQVESLIFDSTREYPARPVFRCALAHLYAQLGRLEEARREFEDLARDGFSVLPFDMEWLYGISLLAETCSLLHDRESAAVLYELLLPWAAFNAVDHPEGMRGSMSRYLGLLATTMERWSSAEEHFENALALNERMGARPWLAHTQRDYARMLLARDGPGDRERADELLRAALATYRELGMAMSGA